MLFALNVKTEAYARKLQDKSHVPARISKTRRKLTRVHMGTCTLTHARTQTHLHTHTRACTNMHAYMIQTDVLLSPLKLFLTEGVSKMVKYLGILGFYGFKKFGHFKVQAILNLNV